MRALLLLALAIAVQAKADTTIGSELLVCVQTTGAMKGQCHLENLSLAAKQPIEKTFTVEYKYPCIGPATDFNIRAGGALQPIAFTTDGKSGSVTITGYGPVDVYDTNPARTLRRPFSKDCSLVISNITSQPSAGTIKGWQDQLNTLKTLLASYTDNRDAFAALAVLEPAYGVYDTFMTNVLNDQVANSELIQAAKGLLDCSDGTTDDGCLTLMDTLVENYRAAKLTDEEGGKLRKLQKSLGVADLSGVLECKPEDTNCTPLSQVLNKYLTADDRATLDKARAKLEVVKGADEKYKTYAGLVTTTQTDIDTLKATAGSYVQ